MGVRVGGGGQGQAVSRDRIEGWWGGGFKPWPPSSSMPLCSDKILNLFFFFSFIIVFEKVKCWRKGNVGESEILEKVKFWKGEREGMRERERKGKG